MNKYKVVKAFTDITTGIGYNEGNTFTSEDDERVSFLAESGYIQAPVNQIKIDESLLAEAKELKIKGYTKMDENALREAIEAIKEKKANEGNGE